MVYEFVLTIAGIGIGAYLTLVLIAYIAQGRLLFLHDIPSKTVSSTPLRIGLKYESIWLNTRDQVRIHGWFIPAPDAQAVVLVLHGNAGNIGHRLETIQVFHELGLSTFIFDYRGYGQSEGHPTEAGTYEDAHTAWRYLTEQRGINPADIILFGRSLGGAVASELATQVQARALILESTFTSVPELAAELYPFVPTRLISRFRYDTREALGKVAVPVLVIHSRDDEIVPFQHAESLYANISGPKQLLPLRGGHNNGFLLGRSNYMSGLANFLALPRPAAQKSP